MSNFDLVGERVDINALFRVYEVVGRITQVVLPTHSTSLSLEPSDQAPLFRISIETDKTCRSTVEFNTERRRSPLFNCSQVTRIG